MQHKKPSSNRAATTTTTKMNMDYEPQYITARINAAGKTAYDVSIAQGDTHSQASYNKRNAIKQAREIEYAPQPTPRTQIDILDILTLLTPKITPQAPAPPFITNNAAVIKAGNDAYTKTINNGGTIVEAARAKGRAILDAIKLQK